MSINQQGAPKSPRGNLFSLLHKKVLLLSEGKFCACPLPLLTLLNMHTFSELSSEADMEKAKPEEALGTWGRRVAG